VKRDKAKLPLNLMGNSSELPHLMNRKAIE
jgi:hypothetical protein